VIGTINFGPSLSGSQTKFFYARVPSEQGAPQGLFLDTVVVYLSSNRTPVRTSTQDFSGSIQVSISTVPPCQIATPLADMLFDHTSWQAVPASASWSCRIRCSISLG